MCDSDMAERYRQLNTVGGIVSRGSAVKTALIADGAIFLLMEFWRPLIVSVLTESIYLQGSWDA